MRSVHLLVVASLAATLLGCGQKGRLLLPDAQHPHKKIGIGKPPALPAPAPSAPTPSAPAPSAPAPTPSAPAPTPSAPAPAPSAPAPTSSAPAGPASAPNAAPPDAAETGDAQTRPTPASAPQP